MKLIEAPKPKSSIERTLTLFTAFFPAIATDGLSIGVVERAFGRR